MISYLQGKIILKKDKFVIIEVAGVGYKVFLNRQNLSRLPEIGENFNPVRKTEQSNISDLSKKNIAGKYSDKSSSEISKKEISEDGFSNGVKVFTYQNVKEEALDLYGFFTYDELEFFETLMDIRGVGPKSALDISALGSLDKIKDRILKQDEKIFEGIPGIGSKKAMTIILELTGKIKMLGQKKGSADEAESALTQLGFSKQQAKDALSRVSAKDPEERIKQALKLLGK